MLNTPRPTSVLGEAVVDNGFFEKNEASSADEDLEAWNPDLNPDQRRDSRSRSEGFHEMFVDEKAKSPAIVLEGNQPLLPRQLNIVQNLTWVREFSACGVLLD